jgi:adenosylcobinamide-GDP ribazoletransferase
VLTGALHLDALADTADALGARTRERALEVMREHTIGAYGAIALVLDLAAKVAALAALAAHRDALRFAVCAAAAGRVAPVLLAAVLPYARPGAGLGRAFESTKAGRCIVAAAIAVGFSVWLGAWPLLVAVAVVTVLVGVGARRWLGGVTGDVLGATGALAQTAALVAATVVVV